MKRSENRPGQNHNRRRSKSRAATKTNAELSNLRTAEEKVVDAVRQLHAELTAAIEPGGGFDEMVEKGALTLEAVRCIVREMVFIDELYHDIPKRWLEPCKTLDELMAQQQAVNRDRDALALPEDWVDRLLYMLSRVAELDPPAQGDGPACVAWDLHRDEIYASVGHLEQRLTRRSRNMIGKYVLRRSGDAGGSR